MKLRLRLDSQFGDFLAEKAAVKATVDAIIAMGGGNKVKISFIPFTNDGIIQDMNPATHTGLTTYTTADSDQDNNGIPDYLQILNSYTSGGSSKFTQVVPKIDTLVSLLPGTPNVIYMSDGYGYLDPTVASSVAADIKSKGGNLNAFAIGAASTYSTLQELDPNAIQVLDINSLTQIFSGFDDRYAKEPFMNGVTVYLDQNNNGQLDPGEPYQITQQDNTPNSLDTNSKYYFTFKDLLPGTYTLRTLLPSGYTMTTPTSNVWTDTITAAGETASNLFGITQASIIPPNHDPVFLTTPPTVTLLSANQEFHYNAIANDPDANIVTYDLVTAPPGMTVDPHQGIVVWSPTTAQVDKYYQDLYAEQARLTAIGRGAYAPTDVEFNILLRATDGKGGQALQYIKVQLVPNNHPPVITSTTPNNSQPQVGKPFQYQVTAIDPDNDPITFSLVNAPTGAVIDAKTGLLTWTPTTNQLGNEQFSVQVQDNKGGSNTQPILLTVVNPHINHPPVFTSTPRTSTRTGNPYTYTLQATDQDNDPLTFSLITAPTGMTLNKGVITWQPTANQFGNNNVSVQVSDGQGGTTTQTWTIQVINHLSNLPPTITSTPNTVTAIGRTYTYKPTAIDPEGDSLIWSLASDTNQPPQGMVIDSATGTIIWQPTTTEIGDTTVDLKVQDAYSAYNIQEFTIKVNGINSPPKIVSTPVTNAGVGQNYTYQVLATDPENDPVTFTLGGKPTGMTITKDGLIQWTPTTDQVGKYDVQVVATDDSGASTSQTYTIIASTTAVNHPPVITSTPVFVAAVGNTYNYQVTASDVDNNTINYKLISGPQGMVIDANTGLLTWATPLTGSYQVVVGADDGRDGAAQGFTLNAKTITPPVITSTTPPTAAVPNTQYRYDIIAVDPSGGQLTYSLDNASVNLGMSVDTQGRLTWTPTISQVGSHGVTLTVTDSAGISSQQNFNLVVAADTTPPQVKLVASYNQVNKGDKVSFQALATDNVQVAGIQLLVNNNPVALDANGIATVTLTDAGTISAVAKAVDTAGNVGQATTSVLVIDPTDTSTPVVNLDLSSIANDTITAATNITGTVTDSNLDYYSLQVAPVGSNDFKEVFRGTTTVNNGVLGKFDPSLLQDDTYTLRLEAHGKNGSVSSTDDTISVAGNLKLGNFRLSFTDLSVPVTGIPVTLTRTYDSLDASNSEDFGYGWRMEFRDTDLRTSVGKASDDLALLGEQNPFKDGTRVYLTLPGGKREGFTFKPVVDKDTAKYVGPLTSATIFHPSFVADNGVTDTLTVENAYIIHGSGTNEYYGLAGNPYNPADPYYGDVYTLTTKEGVKYQIDAQSGKLLTVTDTNGNKLTYTDADITSSTGQKITFGRDAQGRITSVTDPMGKQVVYQYDGNGDLVVVTDRDGNTTQFVYDTTRVHFLDNVIDPLGRTGVRNQYGDDGRLTQILDTNGKAVNLSYDPSHDTETVKDALGNPTTYEYDERGNVVTEVDALGGVTKRTYDDNNDLLSETLISDRSGANGFTTTYTYDNSGNKLSETDPLGNTTYYTYGDKSRLLTETDPLSRTTTNTYDSSGNLLSTKDAAGNITSYGYNQLGLLSEVTDANQQTTKFEYDDYGNVTKITDALGNVTTDTYNFNGDKLTETRQMTTTTGVKNLVQTWTYDNQGHIKTLTDAENHTTTYEYDQLGHQTAVIDALNHRIEYQYDNKGQLVETIYPDSTPNNPDDNPRTTVEYDDAGRKVQETDQAGRVTQYKYDAVGRLIATIYPDNTPNNPNDNPTIKTEYYTDGSVKAQIDELGNRTEYRYDADGRQIEVIYADNTPSTLDDNPTTTYKYDVAGQRIAEIDALGHTTSYVYDNLGQLTQTNFIDGTYTTNTYDPLGRRIATTDQGGKTTQYSYDALGHLTGVKNALGDSTTYSYNEVGNLVSETDANLHTTRFEYDGVGHRTATVLPMGQRSTSTYDAVGDVSTSTDFNGNTITYHYDEQNRLVEKDFPNSTKTTFTYTLTGQRQSVTDVNGTINYTYDEQDRLLSTTNPDGKSISYTYDAAGDRTSVTTPDGTTSYTFDVRNRLSQVIDPEEFY